MKDTLPRKINKRKRKQPAGKKRSGRFKASVQLSVLGLMIFAAAAAILVGVLIAQRDSSRTVRQNITLFAPEQEESTMETEEQVIPVREYGVTLPETFQNPPVFQSTLKLTGDPVLDQANRLAAMYDYENAIRLIRETAGYETKKQYTEAIRNYENLRRDLYQWSDNYKITHIFFHTLIVDPGKSFDEALCGSMQTMQYNEAMTTVDEFVKIIQKMYEDGYVLVDLHDIAEMTEQPDGSMAMQMKPIYLPAGKKPFVLSQDDVCYYEYMTGQGFADRFVIDSRGRVVNEYTLDDGTVIQGSFDVLPILEDFIEAHPDFSYRGAKGTLAVTGYNGVFGYRTSDYWYNWNCTYFDPQNLAEREKKYYHNENIEADKAAASAVAKAIRQLGWNIASHSWGHIYVGSSSYGRVCWDTDMWEKEVESIVGESDTIIFAFGEDLDSWKGYAADNMKFQYLKNSGFDYFCNVDALNPYWIQIGARRDYFRQARRNLDGTRMWEAVMSYSDEGYHNRLEDLFDAREIFDPARPTPVK